MYPLALGPQVGLLCRSRGAENHPDRGAPCISASSDGPRCSLLTLPARAPTFRRYEVCPGVKVLQYHQEDGRPVDKSLPAVVKLGG